MKTFEQNNIRIGNTDGGIVNGMDALSEKAGEYSDCWSFRLQPYLDQA
jgi:hypothetical protein